MKTKTLPKTFEARMERLQTIVTSMERGDVPLEESVALYKEGMQLSQACRKQLENAEHEIRLFSEQGEQGEEAFAYDPKLTESGTDDN